MTNDLPVAELRKGSGVWFYCPGCKMDHRVQVEGKNAWKWNKSLITPTFEPSLLVYWNEPSGDKRCHSYITKGVIRFLPDCTHDLKNQNVPMKPTSPIHNHE